MEPYTLDRDFHKQDVIDSFHSFIWTERYYGDSNVELVVPATKEMMDKLPEGIFLGIAESEEIMIIETREFQNNEMKLSGISLLPWLNNRFVRTSKNPEDRYWYLEGYSAGETLWLIVYNMCVEGSPYLDDTIDIGIEGTEQFAIPGLELDSFDSSGETINVGVPFGPVYDALREIAVANDIGMKITLAEVTDVSYILKFLSYRGIDRTTLQEVNSIVRFSPQLESFTDIKELQTIAELKTLAYVFAPENPDGLAAFPGIGEVIPPQTGFDLRTLQVFADDITTDMVEGDGLKLLSILTTRARDALKVNRFIHAIDGEIVANNQYVYGESYNLGDIVEVQGNTEVIQTAQVIEYIRSQDPTGAKSYPTVIMLGNEIGTPRPPNDDWENSQLVEPEENGGGSDFPEPLYIRYVDFDDGDDDNDGLTKETAWKTIHGGSNEWTFPIEEATYFHGFQIGEGYEYRLRGTGDRLYTLFTEGPESSQYSLVGTAEHPIVFTSWDSKLDRAIIHPDESGYGLESGADAEDGPPDYYGYAAHHIIYHGIDFLDADSVMYGDNVSFIDCTLKLSSLDPFVSVRILNYGDHFLLDRCSFEGNDYEVLLLYGNDITIQNCIFRGLNNNGETIDRDSDDPDENRATDWPWLIYLQGNIDEGFAGLKFINNTIISWGGSETSMYGLGLIFGDDEITDPYKEILIENNIYVDIKTALESEFSDEYTLWSIWSDDDTFESVIIRNNLFWDISPGLLDESLYLNNETYPIDFSPETDILENPNFFDFDGQDYRLRGSSPAIGEADPDVAPNTDRRNQLRDDNPDIGAFELSGGSIQGTNRYATSQGSNNPPEDEGENIIWTGTTVWYKVVVPGAGTLTVWVDGFGLRPITNPKVAVYSDFDGDYIPETLEELDLMGSGDEFVTVELPDDRPYWVQVDVENVSDAGYFTITFDYVEYVLPE